MEWNSNKTLKSFGWRVENEVLSKDLYFQVFLYPLSFFGPFPKESSNPGRPQPNFRKSSNPDHVQCNPNQ